MRPPRCTLSVWFANPSWRFPSTFSRQLFSPCLFILGCAIQKAPEKLFVSLFYMLNSCMSCILYLSFALAGLLASLQGTLSNPTLQSSLSNPNIQSSLSSHSFPNSLSSASLQSSLSNPSLQSSISSSPSLQSSLSNQSLHSSLSNSSLSGQSLPSVNSTVGSGPCLSSYPTLLPGQVQPQLSSSPRRRGQLSPLNLPLGPDSRRHHSKQFSPTISTTLTSITQVNNPHSHRRDAC